MNIQIISAGAGSGKTYRLTQDMAALLHPDNPDRVRATGIFATTFTNKAAAELQDRVRVKLLEDGLTAEADALAGAMIGTVHSLGVKLLKRFAFEAGVSPQVAIIAEEDYRTIFNQSLANVLDMKTIEEMDTLATQLGLYKKDETFDWRKEIKTLCDAARANSFDADILRASCARSLEEFMAFLPNATATATITTAAELDAALLKVVKETLAALIDNDADATKDTQTTINDLKSIENSLKYKRQLKWYEWAKMSKMKVGAKSKGIVEDLHEVAGRVGSHPHFRADIQAFTTQLFEITIRAIGQYQDYKTQRGLIDYTDMEIAILDLLNHETVVNVLRDELDLLLVDEFQDTSPLQLTIFLKLSQIAKKAIWVGDPKQSIYGFRGADPQLMEAVVAHLGGVHADNILSRSWRSRADLVNMANAIFVKAFPEMPEAQVALSPVRSADKDAIAVDEAIVQWNFVYTGDRIPPSGWLEKSVAAAVRELLASKKAVPCGAGESRPIRPSDIAVLCRSNFTCDNIAAAMSQNGIKVAIAQKGLLATPEIRLLLACLKYILQRTDTLSVAEILRLALHQPLEEIIEHRLDYLEQLAPTDYDANWAAEQPFIQKLAALRAKTAELSGFEVLNVVIEELDIRRLTAQWGRAEQRLNNIDALRRYALQYEENCNRLHAAASLGGLLLWLDELSSTATDEQGSGLANDAVQVLTYHKSKGLEWAVTVCMSMEDGLRDRLWGAAVLANNAPFDINNPLTNRWLRYWLNPFADQIKGTPLQIKMDESDAKRDAQAQALREEARLLYVGFTRARDFLIVPTRAKPTTKWLNRVWHDGQEDLPTFSADTTISPFAYGGKQLPMTTQTYSFGREFEQYEAAEERIAFRAERVGRVPHDAAFIDTDKNSFANQKPNIGDLLTYAKPMFAPEDVDEIAFNTMINSAFGVTKTYSTNIKIMVNKVIRDAATADKILAHLNQNYQLFYDKLNADYPNKSLKTHIALSDTFGKRKFSTVIDVMIETKDKRCIIIKNTSEYHNNSQKDKQIAAKYATELYLVASLVSKEKGYAMQKIITLVHFTVGGALVELR